MVDLLLYIKEKFKLAWSAIEWVNSKLFRLLFFSKISQSLSIAANQKHSRLPYSFRLLIKQDIPALKELIENQEPAQLIYFEPHTFDHGSLENIFKNPSFFKMGVFFNSQLVGYFFLRCFINKKCFVGRLVDSNHRGKGIGKTMNDILYHTAWDAGFRCFATVSKKNELVMKAHSHNKHIKVLKDLKDNHLLVEFVE